MGVVHVTFDLNCNVVVGDQPEQPDDPVINPVAVGQTNKRFIMADGLYCFSLDNPQPFTPVWQVGQVSPARVLELEFALAAPVQPAPPAPPARSRPGS
jgi:hypothetical protein